MKTLTKIMIKSFLIYGLIYAGIMVGFDYFREKEFDIWKFLLDFLIFGFFMSLGARYNHKKQGNIK
jgi:hypothetical protein